MKFLLIASFLILEGCLFSKMKPMSNTDDSNFLCDVETGICSPNEKIMMETETKIKQGKATKLKLIYYYDALCGWCFGFTKVN